MQTVTTPTLRPFDRQDWACFAGVETANPLIAFHEGYAFIQDGNILSIIDEENEYRMTLPSERVATLTAAAFLPELAQTSNTLEAANLVESFGFQAL